MSPLCAPVACLESTQKGTYSCGHRPSLTTNFSGRGGEQCQGRPLGRSSRPLTLFTTTRHSIRKRSGTYFSFVSYWSGIFVFSIPLHKTWRGSLLQQSLLSILGATHRCRASIRTLNGPLRGPVQVGVRLQAQVHHDRDEPGIVGCCHLTSDLMDQHIMRSHPNKAVDVIVNQPRKADRLETNKTDLCFSLYAAADWVIVLAIPWPRGS
jgi:hypothetical protein